MRKRKHGAVITDVLCVAGEAGYYSDDLAAIKAGAELDGFFYIGPPQTSGHQVIREPGQALAIMIRLSDGTVGCGDAVAIQYSGVVGRDPIFRAEVYARDIHEIVAPALTGQSLTSFRAICEQVDDLMRGSDRLHTAIRYGISQALLDGMARAQGLTMAEVVAQEWQSVIRDTPVPILAQSGDDRYLGVDRMIMRRVDALPQGLFNSVAKIGTEGELLREYVGWLRDRIERFAGPSYKPTIHLDVYGTIGEICGNDIQRMVEYLRILGRTAAPYALRVETPIDTGDRASVRDGLVALREALNETDTQVSIVADDWCNTLEDVEEFVGAGAADMIQVKAPDLGTLAQSISAVLVCKSAGVGAFLGGTCNGTELSSRACVHAAMGCRADLIYAKPGMSVDEGVMIVRNEIHRILALTGRGRLVGR